MSKGNGDKGVRGREVPRNSVISLQRQIAHQDELTGIYDALKTQAEYATAVFFDLVGSTDYRYTHGSVAGLEKAFRHNLLVSQCIAKHGGYVVKWLGDGVLAVFRESEADVPHAYRALEAAVAAIRQLHEYNANLRGAEGKWVHEIHTRVGICSGDLHFITVTHADLAAGDDDGGPDAEEGHPLTFSDPIATVVDLAARLQGFAEKDVILLDEHTFFGDPDTPARPGVSLTPNGAIDWRDVATSEDRATIGTPQAAIFVRHETKKGIVLSREHTDEFERLPIGAYQGAKSPDVLFVFAPIPCNIRGLPKAKPAVAVSLVCTESPVKHEKYQSPCNEDLEKELDEAEQAHRFGRGPDAAIRFRAVLIRDPRNFRAHLRLAQHSRRSGDIAQARTHWNHAKRSDPKHPLVWTLAGTTYFESYLADAAAAHHDQPPALKDLDRAIFDLHRARKLARDAFDCFLEQYCALLLTVCFLIRARDQDLRDARKLQDELEHWKPMSHTALVLSHMIGVFEFIAMKRSTDTPDYGRALDALQKALEVLKMERPEIEGEGTGKEDRKESLIDPDYLDTLVKAGEMQLQVAKLKRKRQRPD